MLCKQGIRQIWLHYETGNPNSLPTLQMMVKKERYFFKLPNNNQDMVIFKINHFPVGSGYMALACLCGSGFKYFLDTNA